jgi:uncharacterized protein YdiU (UPF0061 family)
MPITNTYLQLGENAFSRDTPTPVNDPKLLFWNQSLASQLGLPQDWSDNAELAQMYFSGNVQIPHSTPIALAYAGHQFGHFNPQLGDGRAHLLGTWQLADGSTRDIQLKGSGRTRFSRQGDGRCALGPAIREYIMSEGMHQLGVSTTRSLAVISSGEEVYRQTLAQGAVVTRVANTHLRIGTFQYFAARQDLDQLRKLVHFASTQVFADKTVTDNPYLDFLAWVMERHVATMVDWMRVGFIHGVMNTDNSLISGETIDYGPCAMLGAFNPSQHFSSIDQNGRYGFANQPNIIMWNLARLAECLLPLIDDDHDVAIAQVEPLFDFHSAQFEQQYFEMLGQKIGISHVTNEDRGLTEELLIQMEQAQLDYTQTFIDLQHYLSDRALSDSTVPSQRISPLKSWLSIWQDRIKEQSLPSTLSLMKSVNPLIVPRNQWVEDAILAAQKGDFTVTQRLLTALKNPYTETSDNQAYRSFDSSFDLSYQTFCGT